MSARRRRLASSLFALALLAPATGCETLVTSYWEDAKGPETPEPAVENGSAQQHVHFLGIRASDQVAAFQVGVRVQHVFGASPAARAGLEPGDELRSLNGIAVRTPADVRVVLAAMQGGDHSETVPIVYWRDGQEYATTVDLVGWRTYLAARRERLFEEAAYSESEFPFFFRWASRELTPSFLSLYYGVHVDEPVRVYTDFTLFPMIPGVAVFRREAFPLIDGSRTQIWHWPFRVSTAGDDRSEDLHDLVPPPPPDTSDL